MKSKFLYFLMACVAVVFSGQVIDDDKDGYADKDELHVDTDSKDFSIIIYKIGRFYNSKKNLFSTDGFGKNCPRDIICKFNPNSF